MVYNLDRILQAARIEGRGDWTGLLVFCQGWVEIEPLNCLAWQGVGDSYRKLAQPEKAIAAYRKGLEVAPPNPVKFLGRTISSAPIWFGLGHALFNLRQLDNASAAFREATRIEPGEATLWNDLGVVCQAQNDYKGATSAFDMAVKLDPHNKSFKNNRNAMQTLVDSQAGFLSARQNGSVPKSPVRGIMPVYENPQPTVKERLLRQASERAAEQEKVRKGAAMLAARLDATARDIDVAATLEVILANIERGQSLEEAMIPVSWGWRKELKEEFVADAEIEMARGVAAPSAIRIALTKFSTR